MKRFLLLAVIFLLSLPAAHGQDLAAQKIDLNIENAPLKTAFAEIQKKSGVNFFFGEDVNKYASTRVNVAADNISVRDAITRTLAGTNLRYTQQSDYVMIDERPAGPATPAEGRGSLSGTVVDEQGLPMVGATVFIFKPGENLGTTTAANGKYTLKNIPAGTNVVQFSFIGYETLEVSGVNIAANRTIPLDIVMKPSTMQVAEVVVTGISYNEASAAGLYARQKSMVAMSDGLSSDLIKKTSDNNVAQVLKRVSGVTIDDGKYVTIRGMSERYNNVQLNGAAMPSTEPNRRNFAFDVIPSGLIDNVTISKTFTPDMQGEFTGGLVDMNTLAVPNGKFLTLGLGTGMNTLSTGKEFMLNKRFSGDWLFGDMKDRVWYGKREGWDQSLNGPNSQRAVYKNTYGLRKYTATPLMNFSATGGWKFDLGRGNSLGVVGALTYRHEENREHIAEQRTFSRDTLFTPAGHQNYRWKTTTATGAVLNAGWKNENHSVTVRNLFNNRFDHRSQRRFIFDDYSWQQWVESYSTLMQNRLWQTQLEGRHNLFDGNLIVDWNASYNKTRRTNPDDRLVTANYAGVSFEGEVFADWAKSTANSNTLTFTDSHAMYSRLDEEKKTAGFDLELPLRFGDHKQVVRAGYLGTFRSAGFEQAYIKPRNRRLENNPVPIPEGVRNSIVDYFAPEAFDLETGYLDYHHSADGNTYYKGRQNIHAAYIMGDFAVLPKLRLIGGMRLEESKTEVTTTQYDNINREFVDSLIVQRHTDFLPAVTLMYSVTPEVILRAAYSKTLARPDMRELSIGSYYNVDDHMEVINNGQLRQSDVQNYDIRAEWYPGVGEVVSIGFFYKKFLYPVESIIRVKSDRQNYELHTMNLDKATARGIEINLRKNLEFVSPALRSLYVSGNYTWMKANVKYNRIALTSPYIEDHYPEADRNRPLQGLSPYVVNAGLQWDGDRFGASVNYNRVGRRLVFAGESTMEDNYENPRDVLDLQLSAKFLRDRNLEVKLNASDILDQDIIIYRNMQMMHYTPENPSPSGATSGVYYNDVTAKGMDYNPECDQLMWRLKKGINLTLSVSYKF